MKAWYIPAAILAAALCFAAFEKKAPSVLEFQVNGESYATTLPCQTTLNLTTLNTEFETEIYVTNWKEFRHLTLNGHPIKAGKAHVHVESISEDRQLVLGWGGGGQSGTVVLNTLNPQIPSLNLKGKACTEGEQLYLSFEYLRLILKLDSDGDILYYKYEPRQVKDIQDCSGWWDFKKHVVDGKTYYSYHEPDYNYKGWAFKGYNPGRRILMDEHYQPIKTIYLSEAPGVNEGVAIDGHDFCLLGPDHYIVMAYLDKAVDGEVRPSAYIQEVRDGEVVFDWWSAEHPDVADMKEPIKELQVLPDGNWLCLLGEGLQEVGIARADGSGTTSLLTGKAPAKDFCCSYGTDPFDRYELAKSK